ncbi:unnamed protein product [Blepharisma stoltei]|uniref:Uncharacterized protein n=1 Tax=Blepharisma stoltei TaxID=1481888 RepID=A0AAU9IUD1_9CILI|nr:unnamed protein product [Blepharisma stoltei]
MNLIRCSLDYRYSIDIIIRQLDIIVNATVLYSVAMCAFLSCIECLLKLSTKTMERFSIFSSILTDSLII